MTLISLEVKKTLPWITWKCCCRIGMQGLGKIRIMLGPRFRLEKRQNWFQVGIDLVFFIGIMRGRIDVVRNMDGLYLLFGSKKF